MRARPLPSVARMGQLAQPRRASREQHAGTFAPAISSTMISRTILAGWC